MQTPIHFRRSMVYPWQIIMDKRIRLKDYQPTKPIHQRSLIFHHSLFKCTNLSAKQKSYHLCMTVIFNIRLFEEPQVSQVPKTKSENPHSDRTEFQRFLGLQESMMECQHKLIRSATRKCTTHRYNNSAWIFSSQDRANGVQWRPS